MFCFYTDAWTLAYIWLYNVQNCNWWNIICLHWSNCIFVFPFSAVLFLMTFVLSPLANAGTVTMELQDHLGPAISISLANWLSFPSAVLNSNAGSTGDLEKQLGSGQFSLSIDYLWVLPFAQLRSFTFTRTKILQFKCSAVSLPKFPVQGQQSSRVAALQR